jgi:hypothetical protein
VDDEHDLPDRLRALGRQPLDAAVHARIRTAMADSGGGGLDPVPDPPRLGRRWSRPAVVAAALAGFLLGSLGLASAGALPAGLQDKAERLLDRVGVDVPPGHVRYNDPTECPGGPYKNHGEYVRSHQDDPNAGTSPCGKPLKSLNHAPDAAEGTESDGTGPPPGKGKDKGAQKGKDHDENDQDDDATTTVPPTSTPPAPSTASRDASTTTDSTATTSSTATTAPPAPESSSSAS